MTISISSYNADAQPLLVESELRAGEILSLDQVAALAGDRHAGDSEQAIIDDIKRNRGDLFYSDILYVVTHRRFPPAVAVDLWNRILQHKCEMSFRMERNVRIAVASLDYLANLTGELHSATVIDESLVAELVRLSQHDSLTGLFNHAYCYQRLDIEVQRHDRYGTPVSLLMLDIDNFKTLNDQYGHIDGDQVLAALGAIIRKTARDSDICCRYGGEEFAIILPTTGSSEAGALAERLRAAVETARLGDRQVTVSIGAASCASGTITSLSLARRADAALYQAKRDGKNRVIVDF